MNQDKVYDMEVKMWEAAKNRNPKAFLDVVSDTAVMVCGGYRCTGKEYAEMIAMFDCKSYSIDHFEIVNENTDSVQVHYVISVEINDEANSDLAGLFHITTTWKKLDDTWKVVFNMDQRIYH